MVNFSLFGVSITIHPMFWLTMAFFGNGFSARTPDQLIDVCLFAMVGAVAILVHELGHALVGRRLGGGYARIELVTMGGLAYNKGGHFTRWGRFWMIAAGPLAGFALGFLVLAGMGFHFGDKMALTLARAAVFHNYGPTDYENFSMEKLKQLTDLFAFMAEQPRLWHVLSSTLWVTFWWNLLNLVPAMPLDGGQIINVWVKPQKLVYQIGIGAAAACAAWGFYEHRTFMGVFFAYYAYQNFQMLRANRWG